MSEQKKNQQLLSWKETWQLNIRVLKLFYKKYPHMILSQMADSIWSALTPYIGIGLSARIIEELSGKRNPDVLKNLVLASLFSAALIALISALINKYKNIAGAGRYFKVNALFSEKMLDMDYCVADDPVTHQKIATIRQNINGGGWGIHRVTSNFNSILQAVFNLLGGAVMTFTLFTSRVPDSNKDMDFLNSPLFLVLIILVMLAITYFAPALSNKAGSYFALNADTHRLANRMFGYFGWLGYRKDLALDMRTYRSDLICAKYNKDKTSHFSSKGYFAKMSWGPIGLYQSASTALSTIFTFVVYLYVCLKAWAGAFGIGMVTQYISATTRFAGAISSLFSITGGMRNNASFLKQTFEFLDLPNVMYQGNMAVEKQKGTDYEIEFKDVSFQYPGSTQHALQHVNMKFKAGQRLAVVGQNGSGKTTFIKLLCRLYDPTEGVILLNGIDIRKYDYKEYLSIFSVVFQDFALTDFSLGENVAVRTDYDGNRVKSCLEKAGFGERFKELQKGLDTYLGKNLNKEGVNMSGGEMQKIAIARALYKDASFIVLDEPTAALDPIAEAEIYSKFNSIVEDKAAIYISHRLSSCRFCDSILVFHKGSIVQQGSHDMLAADESGKYYELWHAQAQYYDENKEC